MTTMAATFVYSKTLRLFDYAKKFNIGVFNNSQKMSKFVRNESAPTFGLLFDIDGVIARGKKVIPNVPEAFKKLVDNNGNFRVPTTFVTNAGNGRPQDKAKQLTEWLDIPISEDKVVMAHTPLRNCLEYHDKCVLVSGQGLVVDIANQIGFKKVVTVDQLREAFPLLDAVDQKRRISVVAPKDTDFPKIECVLLIGEPVRWETSLQLILDVIMTGGVPANPKRLTYPHIPVLACNMDLQWMAEANMPRFGHGAFLLCLEELYKKITGKKLIYSALIGKPSEVTYQYAHHVILYQARRLGTQQVKKLYAIGDNVNTDIFGANLYNDYLTSIRKRSKTESKVLNALLDSKMRVVTIADCTHLCSTTTACYSVLVKTGVYTNEITDESVDHSQRDFLGVDNAFRKPAYTYESAAEAIEMILKLEGFH